MYRQVCHLRLCRSLVDSLLEGLAVRGLVEGILVEGHVGVGPCLNYWLGPAEAKRSPWPWRPGGEAGSPTGGDWLKRWSF